MRATLLLFLLLSLRLSAATSLLVMIDSTAAGYLNKQLDEWVAQVRREGNFSPIQIVETPRWTGNYTNQDWTTLNAMSNIVRRVNPGAIQLIGRHPYGQFGGDNPDGHNVRRMCSDAVLGMTNLAFTDSTSWGMLGTTVLEANNPGDGFPDQTGGLFSIPVARIDFSGMTTNASSGTFSSGYLAGTAIVWGIDEQFALKVYFTNDLAYRTRVWTNAPTGVIYTGIGNYAAAVATNSTVTWTQSGSETAPAGQNYKIVYEQTTLNTFSPNLVDLSGNFVRCLWEIGTKSYNFESYEGYGGDGGIKFPQRRLAPGFISRPIALIFTWSKASFGVKPRWLIAPSDVTVADAIRSSAAYQNDNTPPYYISFGASNVYGDLTLPVSQITQQPPGRITTTTLTVNH